MYFGILRRVPASILKKVRRNAVRTVQGQGTGTANLNVMCEILLREDAEMSERTCPNCGQTVPDAKFCAECGERMAEEGVNEQAEAAGPAEESPEETGETPAEAPPSAAPPPPPPCEKRHDAAQSAEPPEVAGAEQSGAEIPPTEPPITPESFHPEAPSEAEPESEQAGVTPDELEPRGSE